MTIKYLDSKRIVGLSTSGSGTTVTESSINDVSHFEGTVGANYVIGEQITGGTLVGKTITSLSFYLYQLSSGSGGTDTTFTFGIWNSSGVLQKEFGSVNRSSFPIGTAFGNAVKFTGTATESGYVLATNDVIGLRTNTNPATAWTVEIGMYDGNSYSDGQRALFVQDSSPSITSARDIPFEAVYDQDVKPTNVQDNSILVEKDTANRFWFDALSESPVNITWSTTGNVAYNISGTTISRTGSSGWGTSKIQSEDTFTVGDGTFMIEFSGGAGSTNSTMLGFNQGTLGYYIGSPQNKADFSIYMAGGDQVEVYENGSKNYGSGGSRSASDKYRIQIDNDGLVKYYLQAGGTGSWVLKYTSSTTASGTYFIQANSYSSTSVVTVHSKTVTIPAKWTMNPTYETLDSTNGTTGWDVSNGGSDITKVGDTIRITGSGAKSGYYDLGANVSTSKWLLRFKWQPSGTPSSDPIAWVAVSNVNTIISNSTVRDAISFMAYSAQNYKISEGYNSRMDQSNTQLDTSPVVTINNTLRYVELKRDGSNAILTFYDSDTYTTSIGTITTTIRGSGYRYLVPVTYIQGSGRVQVLSNVVFYNGVTSV